MLLPQPNVAGILNRGGHVQTGETLHFLFDICLRRLENPGGGETGGILRESKHDDSQHCRWCLNKFFTLKFWPAVILLYNEINSDYFPRLLKLVFFLSTHIYKHTSAHCCEQTDTSSCDTLTCFLNNTQKYILKLTSVHTVLSGRCGTAGPKDPGALWEALRSTQHLCWLINTQATWKKQQQSATKNKASVKVLTRRQLTALCVKVKRKTFSIKLLPHTTFKG